MPFFPKPEMTGTIEPHLFGGESCFVLVIRDGCKNDVRKFLLNKVFFEKLGTPEIEPCGPGRYRLCEGRAKRGKSDL